MFLGKWLRIGRDEPRDDDLAQQVRALSDEISKSTDQLRKLTGTLKERTPNGRRNPGSSGAGGRGIPGGSFV